MKVIICGGRTFTNTTIAYPFLDKIHAETPITHVIEGGAKGGDLIGRNWAHSRKIDYTTVNAEWDKYGRSAGPKRNIKMADMKPDTIIALPGGTGTAHMIKTGQSRGIRIIQLT